MSTSRPPRRLRLHPSALSDAEYTVYMDALHEVLDGADVSGLTENDLDSQQIDLREVRAWLKGRFKDLGVPEIDKARLELYYHTRIRSQY